VRSHYLQYVEGSDFLVELGCGRGEFLELASAVVTRVRGVDVDPEMVRIARAAGIDVVEADVRDYLASTDDRPDAVFVAHLVEHLSVEATFDMLSAIASMMAPGGVIILVTPNPACLAMLTSEFWSDPTHVRPYTPDLLEFLLSATGFEVTSRAGNPLDTPGPPPQLLVSDTLPAWGSLADELNEWDLPPERATDELSLVRREVAVLRHLLTTLDQRTFDLRHVANHISARLNDTLQFLYPANEIYVVGRRNS
jgi:SAM-dependent methyltransferase